ncbi:hypothetical protein PHYC_01704 [Phycisphaerales bacterium]|nr:hypothetical protein PHYC_01704 [Phycisphaerales bacterium]
MAQPPSRYMVSWTWIGPDDDPSVNARIAPERAMLGEWARRGALLERFINRDETRGWLVLAAADQAAARALVDQLPLRRWLDVGIDTLQ